MKNKIAIFAVFTAAALFGFAAYAEDIETESKAGDKETTEKKDSSESIVAPEEKKQTITDEQVKDPNLREYKDGEMINIVQRGFYMFGNMGYSYFLGDVGKFAPHGVAVGFGLGYDVLDKWLQVELAGMAISASANIKDQSGFFKTDAKLSGSHTTVMGLVQVNGTYAFDLRLLAKLKVGGGVAWDDKYINGYSADLANQQPDKVASIGGAIATGLAVEYYTKMRNFSVGMNIDFYYLLAPKAMALSFIPSVKYTF